MADTQEEIEELLERAVAYAQANTKRVLGQSSRQENPWGDRIQGGERTKSEEYWELSKGASTLRVTNDATSGSNGSKTDYKVYRIEIQRLSYAVGELRLDGDRVLEATGNWADNPDGILILGGSSERIRTEFTPSWSLRGAEPELLQSLEEFLK